MKKKTGMICRGSFRFTRTLVFHAIRRHARGAAVLLLCAMMMLNLSACWSRVELDTLAIVIGTGLDVGDQPNTLKLTAQVVRVNVFQSGASSGQGASGEKAYMNIQNTDKSMYSAVMGITHMTNRQIYFAHNEILIVGSELAKKNISQALDAFMRDNEERLTNYILVAKGEASEILDEQPELEKIPAMHISSLIENQKTNSQTVIVTLRDFAIAMLSGSMSPVAPMIELYETYDGKTKARLSGTAVFRQGQMVGELDIAQTRGLLFVTGKAQSGAMTVDTKWGQVTLQILHSESSLKPVKMKDGTIRMKLNITEEGYIEGNESTLNVSKIDNLEMLKKLEAETIRSDVENVLAQARALHTDIFGFGDMIRREYPDEWEKMKGNWYETFCDIELDVKVDVELRSTGAITAPVTPGGAE